MAGGHGGLQCVGAGASGLAQLLGPGQRGQAAADEQPVPAAAVLLQQQHGLAFGIQPRWQARGLDLQQGRQALHLALVGQQVLQLPHQAQRFVAELGAHIGMALVEDQVDHRQHGV